MSGILSTTRSARPPIESLECVEVLLGQAADGRAVEVRDAVHGRARPGRAIPGMASNVWRASRSSPAPWTCGWLARTCSISVVPDRGRPKTNTGRRVSWPVPAIRAKNAASNVLQQAVDEPLVVGRDVLAAALGQLHADGVGLAQAFGGAGVVAAGVEHVGQGEEEPGAGSWARLGSASRSSSSGEIRVGQLAAEQRRQPGVRDREVRLEPQRRAEGRLGLVQLALLLVEPADVELGRGRVGLDLQRGARNAHRASIEPALFLQRPAQREMEARSLLVSQGQHALPAAGSPRPGSSRSMYSSARISQKRRVGRVELDGPLEPGQGVVELALAGRISPRWACDRARSGSSRSASRYEPLASTSRFKPRKALPRLWCKAAMSGLEPHRLLAVRQRLLRLAAVQEHLAQVGPGRREGRLELDRPAEMLQRLVALAETRAGRCPGCCGPWRTRAAVPGARRNWSTASVRFPSPCRARPRLHRASG